MTLKILFSEKLKLFGGITDFIKLNLNLNCFALIGKKEREYKREREIGEERKENINLILK